MKKIFLALGSNIGDRKKNIDRALHLLQEKVFDIKASRIYVSKAVGYEKQPEFFNMVARGFTELSPYELLDFVKDVEKRVGRIKRFRWGPREIDIDILFYEDMQINSDILIIPHPRLHERDFVLYPLAEIEPDYIHPVFQKPISQLLENVNKENILDTL